ncbi:uncharacterized protein LY89DRAFT_221591 [Mollisia scopiformis]|uniref:Uncharacterized protein n=1 Tax=Mollisia scopiformis TaxID=149040 RepID=A0A194WWM3_MOLSC|nr:uncharacterized protein LY89DRAFT_221591 [Mollisia scopiformis]KUJ12084.1 hypothetical protein LY89DRAFT_221591 [Mollisia scopiformis]
MIILVPRLRAAPQVPLSHALEVVSHVCSFRTACDQDRRNDLVRIMKAKKSPIDNFSLGTRDHGSIVEHSTASSRMIVPHSIPLPFLFHPLPPPSLPHRASPPGMLFHINELITMFIFPAARGPSEGAGETIPPCQDHASGLSQSARSHAVRPA